MISEFHDLSDKIDQLAEMTQALRRENAALRQSNTTLAIENESYKRLLERAQARLLELLAKLPPDPAEAGEAHTLGTPDPLNAQSDEAAR